MYSQSRSLSLSLSPSLSLSLSLSLPLSLSVSLSLSQGGLPKDIREIRQFNFTAWPSRHATGHWSHGSTLHCRCRSYRYIYNHWYHVTTYTAWRAISRYICSCNTTEEPEELYGANRGMWCSHDLHRINIFYTWKSNNAIEVSPTFGGLTFLQYIFVVTLVCVGVYFDVATAFLYRFFLAMYNCIYASL